MASVSSMLITILWKDKLQLSVTTTSIFLAFFTNYSRTFEQAPESLAFFPAHFFPSCIHCFSNVCQPTMHHLNKLVVCNILQHFQLSPLAKNIPRQSQQVIRSYSSVKIKVTEADLTQSLMQPDAFAYAWKNSLSPISHANL